MDAQINQIEAQAKEQAKTIDNRKLIEVGSTIGGMILVLASFWYTIDTNTPKTPWWLQVLIAACGVGGGLLVARSKF